MSQERTAYARRFGGSGEHRTFVLDLPPREVFEPHIRVGARVFDLGCARGDYINNGSVAKRYAMAVSSGVRFRFAPGIGFIERDCSQHWSVANVSRDVIFPSQFLECPKAAQASQPTLGCMRCVLRENRTLIALPPDIRYITGENWDVIDNRIAPTDHSVIGTRKRICGSGLTRTEIACSFGAQLLKPSFRRPRTPTNRGMRKRHGAPTSVHPRKPGDFIAIVQAHWIYRAPAGPSSPDPGTGSDRQELEGGRVHRADLYCGTMLLEIEGLLRAMHIR